MNSPRSQAVLIPLFAAVLLLTCMNVFYINIRISNPWPNSAWEPVILLDSWRMVHPPAHPIYSMESPSPLTYGPMKAWTLGQAFKFTGPNLWMGRFFSLGSALLATGILAWVWTRKRAPLFFIPAWCFLMTGNLVCKNYYVDARPDMEAILFSVLGILAFYRGCERGKHAFCLLGTVCLVIGFFYKQTAAIWAAVPLVVVVLEWNRTVLKRKLLFAAFPLLVFFLLLIGMKLALPDLYRHMIEAASNHKTKPLNFLARVSHVMLYSPPLIATLFCWLTADGFPWLKDSRLKWLIASAIVGVPACTYFASGGGGDLNSLIPVWLIFASFCVHSIDSFRGVLAQETVSFKRRMATSCFLALLLMAPAGGHMLSLISWTCLTHGDEHYSSAIECAKALPGRVICPQDPGVVFFAKGYAGRSVYAELDQRFTKGEWPNEVPQCVIDEVRQADWVISVESGFGASGMISGLLAELKFQAVRFPDLDGSVYRVWRRTGK
ncbi:MAG: hypothetical protein PHV34_08750 [Verrucomicrobiae bacterium]|nr:hypothetical protein [Verrucomicrobiae bacterium]